MRYLNPNRTLREVSVEEWGILEQRGDHRAADELTRITQRTLDNIESDVAVGAPIDVAVAIHFERLCRDFGRWSRYGADSHEVRVPAAEIVEEFVWERFHHELEPLWPLEIEEKVDASLAEAS